MNPELAGVNDREGNLARVPHVQHQNMYLFQIITNKCPQYEMEITGSSRGQTTSVAQSFGVRRIHTFAWDVGILVSRRNWNIPRITWSIIPIVQEFQGGHATTKKRKIFWGQSKAEEEKAVASLADRRSVVREAEAETRLSLSSLPSSTRPPRWHPPVSNSNFTLLNRQTEELSEIKPSHFVVSS